MKCKNYTACKSGWENKIIHKPIKECPNNTDGDCNVLKKRTCDGHIAIGNDGNPISVDISTNKEHHKDIYKPCLIIWREI